jgi:hypothetical protein
MSGDDNQGEEKYGHLMACLMRERDRYATESDFRDFALESVRRFVGDLRALNIELTMRPKYLEQTSAHFSAKE